MSSPSCLKATEVLKLVEPGGLLEQKCKGFESRPSQCSMMANVLDAYNHDQIVLIEAGTGIGKSLAYLVPALLWAHQFNEATVISTNTIALQEQLLRKDIPSLIKTLGIELKVVLVKGMSNYVCLRKLDDALAESRFFSSEENEEIEKIDHACRTITEGSRSTLPIFPSPSTWERVNADGDTCSHQQCPHFKNCFFFKARKEAQEAQILLVNHHLLFSDIVKRSTENKYNETAILPAFNRIVLDEAHHIEDIATDHFAVRLHRIELLRVLGKLTSDRLGHQPGKIPMLRDKLYSFYGKTPPDQIGRIITRLNIDLPALRINLQQHIDSTFDAFIHFIEVTTRLVPTEEGASSPYPEKKLRLLKSHQTHSKWIEEIEPKTTELKKLLKTFSQTLRGLEFDLSTIKNERLQEQTRCQRGDIQLLNGRLDELISLLEHFISEVTSLEKVRWIEAHQLKSMVNVHLIDADLDVSKSLAKYLFSKFGTIVLCSATMTTNREFQFIRNRLGLQEDLLGKRVIKEAIYDSPFNYLNQALLAVPIDLPLPSHSNFMEEAIKAIWNAIECSRGGVFVLFTSYSMLQKCHEALKERLENKRYQLFKQGDSNRTAIIEAFKKTDRGVLLGTDSFWEGVDVVGDSLRCVVIVKLPFRVPSEPIIEARTEEILKNGGNPFFDYAIPNAIVKFKQGFGRLIRSQRDRGCIICLDTRLVKKNYGRLFLNSLPNCSSAFLDQALLWPKLEEFYKKTYPLTKELGISQR